MEPKKGNDIFIDEFDYGLPPALIAEFPLSSREDSKLLVFRNGEIKDKVFSNLPILLPDGAPVILNNTKVIEARILFQKESGGIIEIFCLEPFSPREIGQALNATTTLQWNCLVGGASKWKPGQLLNKHIKIGNKEIVLQASYIDKQNESFIIEFSWNEAVSFSQILHAAGNIPLPPYIKRKAEESDAQRYQTVFARYQGSVAAPTAALHFTDGIFEKFRNKNIPLAYVTLHVGAGTFKPVKTLTIADHQMHSESFSLTAEVLELLSKADTLVAVGTTSLRTLESLYWIGVKFLIGKKELTLSQWEAYELPSTHSWAESLSAMLHYMQNENQQELNCRTALLIMPGYSFKSAKVLITNFHQPRSTLLLLVAAFIGEDWKKVYAHALQNNYRFLSYGDSSLLWRKD